MGAYIRRKPALYTFGPDPTKTSPLRLWDPPFMGDFGGSSTMSLAQMEEEIDYVELLVYRQTSNAPFYNNWTSLNQRRLDDGKPELKGLEYSIGAVEWKTDPSDAAALYPPEIFYYAHPDPPAGASGAQLDAKAAITFGNSWVLRVDSDAALDALVAEYTGFSRHGIIPDVMGPYPTTGYTFNGFTITNGTWAGSVSTFTTSIAHLFSVGDSVVVSGCTPSGFNGTFTVLSTPTGTTFTVSDSDPGGTTTTGNVHDNRPWNYDTQSAGGWYGSARWLSFTRDLIGRLGYAMGSRGIAHGSTCRNSYNGISDGNAYANDATKVLLDTSDLGMVEQFVRGPTDPMLTFNSETLWRADVDMMIDAEKRYYPLLCCTKYWPNDTPGHISTGPHTPSAGDITTAITNSKRWFKYALGTFLLGTNGLHLFHYRHDNPDWTFNAGTDGDGSGNDTRGRHHFYPGLNFYSSVDQWYLRVNLGEPTQFDTLAANMEDVANCYSRTFANGVVLVNPSGSTSAGFNMPGSGGDTYRDVDDTTVAGGTIGLTLGAHTARIFSKD